MMSKKDNSIYVPLYEEDISILPFNEFSDLYEAGIFALSIKTSKGRHLELNLSVDQIRVIKDLFDQYLIAFEANRRLEIEYSVKARSGSV